MDIPMETFQKTFESGILATLRLTKAVVPHMASRKRGIIVNVGSMTGQMLVVSYSSYHHRTDKIIHLVQLPGAAPTARPNQPSTPLLTPSIWSSVLLGSMSCSSSPACSARIWTPTRLIQAFRPDRRKRSTNAPTSTSPPDSALQPLPVQPSRTPCPPRTSPLKPYGRS
jgi:hypothetical protein